MSPLKSEIVVRSLAHSTLELEVVRGTCFNLTTPHINASSLVTFIHGDFAEFVTTSVLIVKAIVVVILIAIFVEPFVIDLIFSLLLRLSRCLSIHEVLPLENSLVFATCGDAILLSLGVLGETDIGDMLGMTRVLLVGSFVDGAWILKQLDHSEVIASCQDLTIWGALTGIDVGAVSAGREDSLDWPAKRARPGGPWLILVHGCARRDLFARAHVVEKNLVTRAVRHQGRGVLSEVKVRHCAVMASDLLQWGVVASNVVCNDHAVVSSHCTNTVIRRVLDALDRLSFTVASLAQDSKV